MRETVDSMASADLVLTCALFVIDCVFDKRDMCSNLSIDSHMPFSHQFPLAQKVEGQMFETFCREASRFTSSVFIQDGS